MAATLVALVQVAQGALDGAAQSGRAIGIGAHGGVRVRREGARESGAGLADADQQRDPLLHQPSQRFQRRALGAPAGDPDQRCRRGAQRGGHRQRAGGDGVLDEVHSAHRAGRRVAPGKTRERAQAVGDGVALEPERPAGERHGQRVGDLVLAAHLQLVGGEQGPALQEQHALPAEVAGVGLALEREGPGSGARPLRPAA